VAAYLDSRRAGTTPRGGLAACSPGYRRRLLAAEPPLFGLLHRVLSNFYTLNAFLGNKSRFPANRFVQGQFGTFGGQRPPLRPSFRIFHFLFSFLCGPTFGMKTPRKGPGSRRTCPKARDSRAVCRPYPSHERPPGGPSHRQGSSKEGAHSLIVKDGPHAVPGDGHAERSETPDCDLSWRERSATGQAGIKLPTSRFPCPKFNLKGRTQT